MESLCSSSLHPTTSSCFCSLRPIPIKVKPSRLLRTTTTCCYSTPSSKLDTSSSKPHPILPLLKPDTSSPLISLLKPLCLTIATAAASFSILLFRFPSLALASSLSSSPPATTSDTLIQPEPDSDQVVASLRAEVENKIEQGDFTGGIQTLDRLIEFQPDNSDFPLLKAHLLSHLGDVNSAKRTFESILEKDFYYTAAYHGLIATTSSSESAHTELRAMTKRIEDMIELCKKEKDGKEKVRDFKLLLAQIKVILGEYEESLKVYGEMEKEEPTDFRPYLCRAVVYTLLKNKDEAEKQFEKYKQLVQQGHPYENFFDELVSIKSLEREMRQKDWFFG